MYPVLSDLKLMLSVAGTSEDTLLSQYLAEAIAFVEKYTGRVFVAESEARDFPLEKFGSATLTAIRVYMEFVSVDTVAVDGEEIPTSEYYAESYNGHLPYSAIRLYRNSPYRFTSTGIATITANWGYSANCPDDVFGAILQFASWRYRNRNTGAPQAQSTRAGIVFAGTSLPESVVALLANYRKVYF